MTTIYLIRHGQASFGQANYDQLSPRGEEQAQVLGQYLKQLLQEVPYVMAGSMLRHQQTAELALAECFPSAEVQTNASWNEFDHQQVFAHYTSSVADPSPIQQAVKNPIQSAAYLKEIFHAAIARWTGGEYHHEYDESWPVFQQRIEQALHTLCDDLARHKPRYALIFTSGGVISNIVGQVLELSLHKTFELNWAISNASISTLRLSNQDTKLLSLNEHHFLKAKNTELLTWI